MNKQHMQDINVATVMSALHENAVILETSAGGVGGKPQPGDGVNCCHWICACIWIRERSLQNQPSQPALEFRPDYSLDFLKVVCKDQDISITWQTLPGLPFHTYLHKPPSLRITSELVLTCINGMLG